MALFKRGTVWYYEFERDGRRICKSAKTTNRLVAERLLDKVRAGAEQVPVRDPGRDPGVYFLRSKLVNLVKIGCSANVARRVEEIQNWNPEELILVGRIDTPEHFAIEALIHTFFARHHVRREWFSITDDDVQFAVQYWERLKDSPELVAQRYGPVTEERALYSIEEVAKMFAMSESYIRILIRRGELKRVKYGTLIRIEGSEIRDFIERHRGKPEREIVQTSTSQAALQAPEVTGSADASC